MKKTLTINKKRFTAKQIAALPRERTNGDDYIVYLNGQKFFFNFRDHQDDIFAPVCSPARANCIALMPDDGSWDWKHWLEL